MDLLPQAFLISSRVGLAAVAGLIYLRGSGSAPTHLVVLARRCCLVIKDGVCMHAHVRCQTCERLSGGGRDDGESVMSFLLQQLISLAAWPPERKRKKSDRCPLTCREDKEVTPLCCLRVSLFEEKHHAARSIQPVTGAWHTCALVPGKSLVGVQAS